MGRRKNDGFQYGKKPLIERILEEYAKTPGQDPMDLDLTEEEQRILERWIFIDGLMRKHRPKLMMKDIEAITRRRYGISNGQFWSDYKNTDRLFGTTFSRSKAYTKAVYVEHLEMIASNAGMGGDYKSQIKALEVAAQIQGLMDKDDTEIPADEPKQFIMPILISGDNQDILPEIINLDELNRLKPELFTKVINMVDQPSVGPEQMQKLLLDESDPG